MRFSEICCWAIVENALEAVESGHLKVEERRWAKIRSVSGRTRICSGERPGGGDGGGQ